MDGGKRKSILKSENNVKYKLKYSESAKLEGKKNKQYRCKF